MNRQKKLGARATPPGEGAADTVDPSLIHFLLHAAQRLGVKRDALADADMRAFLDRNDPDVRLPYPWWRRLWTRLVALRPNEPLGARVAEAGEPARFGTVRSLIMHAPTFEEALACVARFQRLTDPRTTWALVREGGRARLVLRADPWVSELGHPAEALLATVAVLGGALHPDVAPERIDVAHAPPARAENAAAMRALCGAEVRFGAVENAVTFPESALSLALPAAAPRPGVILEQHARRVLAAIPASDTSLQRRVWDLICACQDGPPDGDEIARVLGMSRRTLQQRLQEEGASFARLLDNALCGDALSLVGNGRVRLVEAAFLAGFSDARAFARAFRRWTGQSPARWRRSRV